MKILCSVLNVKVGGCLELQSDVPYSGPSAPIGLVLPGSQNWLTVNDAHALRSILQMAIEWAERDGEHSLKLHLEQKPHTE